MKCAYPRCRNTEVAVVYLGRPLCERCWAKHGTYENTDKMRRALGLPPITKGDTAPWQSED